MRNWRTTTFKLSTQSGMKSCEQSLTDLLTACWKVCSKMQVEKSEELKNWSTCCMSTLRKLPLATRSTIIANRSWWPKDISNRKSRIPISERETETSSKQRLRERKRQRKCQTPLRKEIASVAPQKANVHSEKHAHSSMTRTRKAKGRDLVHLLRHNRRTEIRWMTEKVVMTEVQEAHQNWQVKVRQGKRTDSLGQTSRKKVAKGENHLIAGMFRNVQNSKYQVDARLGDKRAYNHRAKPADEKKNSAFPFHRMMRDRCNNGQFSRIIRPNTEWDFIISWTTFSKGKMGPTLGVIQTGTRTQRNPNSPTFAERSVERNLNMEEKARKPAWISHKHVCKDSTSYSENRHWFFKPSPASNVSSPSFTNAKWKELIGDSAASLDLAPEEKETIQKWKLQMELLKRLNKEPHMRVIRTCLFKFNHWKNHPRYCRLVNCAKKLLLVWMTSRPAIISYQAWKNVKCKTNNHVPLVVPGVQATEKTDQSSGRTDNRITRMASAIHGRIHKEIFKFNRCVFSWRVHATSSNSSFRTSSSKTNFKHIWRQAQCIPSFSQEDPNCEVCRRTNVMRAPCKTNLADWETELRLLKDMGIWYHSPGNKFERFRRFLELIRFSSSRNYFLNDSNFWWVQSSITHNVAVHVHVLWPVCTHTIPFRSNVVASVTIHDDMYSYVYIYKKCFQKNKTIVEGQRLL